MIALDISTACGYNFRKEHYLVLLLLFNRIQLKRSFSFQHSSGAEKVYCCYSIGFS